MSNPRYDPFAAAYDRFFAPSFVATAMAALEHMLLPRLPDGAAVLDLCCGTGQLAGRLHRAGFQVTGLDLSEKALALARVNAPGVHFVQGDARSFRLEPVDAVVCVYDSLNHFTSLEELDKVMSHAHAAVRPGGWLVADVNTEAGFQARWQGALSIVRDDVAVIAQPRYDAPTRLGHFDIVVFERHSGRWERSDLSIVERCFSPGELETTFVDAGFEIREAHEARAFNSKSGVGRVFYALQRTRGRE